MHNLESEIQHEPKELAQIDDRTGVSADYINEYTMTLSGISFCESHPDFTTHVLQNIEEKLRTNGKLIRKYEERYSPNEWRNVINQKNKQTVENINYIADEIKSQINAVMFNKELNDAKKIAAIEIILSPALDQTRDIISGSEAQEIRAQAA